MRCSKCNCNCSIRDRKQSGYSSRQSSRYSWSNGVRRSRRRDTPSPMRTLSRRSRTEARRPSQLRPHKMMLESNRYDKWDRDRGGGGGGGGGAVGVGAGVGGGAPGGAWAGRDREKDRERERQARAHQQMSHAEPDASSLFPAPIRVTGNRDRVSQQIQTKLGDYQVAQFFIDDPSKSIGICAEPPSPAPCPPSRRESEFKKPAHAPQNGRVHHRPYPYNKNDGPSSTGAPAHRPPPLRIANGFQTQSAIESSQPPIESILKEMKSLPTQLSAIAATPRKEAENKFIFNPYTNKVQENPQLTNTDLRSPITKPGLDNRISNSRSSTSPDVVNKDLGLSESDDEVAANSHRLGPPLSPINSGSPSSGSSSQSDSETESSSAASPTPTATVEAPSSVPVAPALTATAPAPAQRPSWGLSNFVPPAALDPTFDSEKDHLRHALADVKDKPSPISDMSDSETSSPSPGVSRRRRSTANRASTASSDEETPRHHTTTSPRVATSAQSAPLKRGRPPKARPSEERPPKKKRGRPPKTRPPSPPALPPRVSPPPMVDSDVEPDPPPTQHHHTSQDNKSQIFRKVFTPRKGDEGGGKGGKGGKGKGGKGKGQVTIIDGTAPELMGDDEDRRHRERSNERRNEEALARVSPPRETESIARRREAERREAERREAERREVERREAERLANERLQERVSIERTVDRPVERSPCSRIPSERTSNDRIPSDKIATERTSNDRIPPDRPPGDRHSDRIPIERLSNDRLSTSDRLSDRHSRLSSERLSTERLTAEKMAHERLSGERHSHDRLPVDKHERSSSDRSHDRLSEGKIGRISDNKLSIDRLPESKLSIDRYAESKLSMDRLAESKTVDSKVSSDRLSEGKMSIERVSESKAAAERLANERYVRAEADLGAGLKPGRGSERLEEASSVSERRSRPRVMVRVPLARLRNELVRALQRPVPVNQPVKRHAPISEPGVDVGATNHERTGLSAEQTPIYYSYFERLPADTLSAEERNHKYYLEEATRLRTAADREQEPLSRVMLLLESVLCFVLTGRVMELEFDTKGAFTIYRQTIAYIKLIHSMPQRFRASPPDTFNKLDILSLRVQALLYLRMFKMYNPEVQEYNKIVHEYQQKPACAESASPLSPSPSPAGSVGSVGSGASASSGYCSSLVHSVPAHAHQALLLLTKYFTFLYVAHELWEQADTLCRLRDNQDLFIAVDRKCGPLSLSSTFRHLVQYVRYAISLLKNAPRE